MKKSELRKTLPFLIIVILTPFLTGLYITIVLNIARLDNAKIKKINYYSI